MFFRSYKSDIFRYSFTRYVLGSIFLVGCLLVLTVFSDSRRAHIRRWDPNPAHHHQAQDTSTHLTLSTRENISPRRLEFVPEDPALSDPDEDFFNQINGWTETEFPEVRVAPKVATVLENLRKKVAGAGIRQVLNWPRFQYIHNVPDACAGGKEVELLVVVSSPVRNFELRHAVRDSWGQHARLHPSSAKAVVLFFVGELNDPVLQERVNSEALIHGDVVQANFLDSYRNSSLKTLSELHWASTFCPNSSFVLKANDDVYVNLPRLQERLRDQLRRGPMFLMGTVMHNTEPVRDQKHQWHVTRQEYPAKVFPNYLSGAAYAMSTAAALRLYVESLYIKPLFMEDVYVTGVVADRANIPRVGEQEFHWAKVDPYGCLFRYKISGGQNSPDELRKIHQELEDPHISCY